MARCDRLKASIDQTTADRRRLLDTVLAEAFAPLDVVAIWAAE